MLKYIQLSITLLVLSQSSMAQLNTTLLGQFQYAEELNDVWHYVDGENEYALVGTVLALSIVDVTNPSAPFEVAYIPGATSNWRDIKTYQNFAYVTNETSDGLLIVDLSDLPNGASTTNFTGNNGVNFTRIHNLFIDTDAGYCYLFGSNYSEGGAIILDLNNNPASPNVVGVYDEEYVHDGTVLNDKLYTAEIYNGWFRIIDVSDVTNPTVIGQQGTSEQFTHNIWPSSDGQKVYTTDEVSGAFVEAYDVSDPSSIIFLDKIQSNPGSGVIPHNAHWINDFVVVSYYRDGVVIYDVSDPSNLFEVGNYDHSFFSGDGFNGGWGADPFLPSGNILCTDVEEGLFIIEFNGTRASYIDGTVSDATTGALLQDVHVEVLLSSVVNDTTNSSGYYSAGFASSGIASISYSKFGYESYVESNVNLLEGLITTVDVQLTPEESFMVSGQVLDQDGNGISGSHISISNTYLSQSSITDQTGSFILEDVLEDDYTLFVGQWGYLTTSISSISLSPDSSSITVELEEGYCDDFVFDFGWTSSGDASSGFWELGEPIGTLLLESESNPELDVDSDFGQNCYVTGNGGGSSGNDDIDNGSVILTSPSMNLSDYNEPEISYNAWFFNDGGAGTPNDSFYISLTDGSNYYNLETFAISTDGWQQNTFLLDTSVITLADDMYLVLRALDTDPFHIVEAAFDAFKLIDLNPTTAGEEPTDTTETFISIIDESLTHLSFENPFTNRLEISYSISGQNINELILIITDMNGRQLESHQLAYSEGSINLKSELKTSGLYFIHLYDDGKILSTKKLIKL